MNLPHWHHWRAKSKWHQWSSGFGQTTLLQKTVSLKTSSSSPAWSSVFPWLQNCNVGWYLLGRRTQPMQWNKAYMLCFFLLISSCSGKKKTDIIDPITNAYTGWTAANKIALKHPMLVCFHSGRFIAGSLRNDGTGKSCSAVVAISPVGWLGAVELAELKRLTRDRLWMLVLWRSRLVEIVAIEEIARDEASDDFSVCWRQTRDV